MAGVTVGVCRRSHKWGYNGDRNPAQHCRQQPQRVTSAICADGCATVRSGAKSKPKRARTNRRLSNRSFPNQSLTTTLAIARTRPPTRLPRPQSAIRHLTRASPQPRPGAGKGLRRDRGVIVIATVDEGAVDVAAGHKYRRRHRQCRRRAALRAKLLRPMQLRN